MNYTDINRFIKHYLEQDKTQRAIMMTADWGTGKSYYIQNTLIPFLSGPENDNHKCIVVSLYGLSRIEDISKVLYLEVRAKALSRATEKAVAGKLIAKTVVRGVSSFFGIDLNASEKDLAKLYKSIDLSGKLVVFEDIERSGIDVLDFLGYVNNLVEQDNVKVLLVANESEINKTDKYYKTKEKTVSDTIQFKGNLFNAIKDIISIYGDKLKYFANNECVKDILNIMSSVRNNNLRSFIFACQKTVDILDIIGEQETAFQTSIFYGIVTYSFKMKTNDKLKWSGTTYLSVELSSRKYPLFHFCYDYIVAQTFDLEEAIKTAKEYKDFCLYDNQHSYDKDISNLSNYYIITENDLTETIESIRQRLSNPEDVPFYHYANLIIDLLNVEKYFDYSINDITEKMINNIKGRGDKVDGERLFLGFPSSELGDLKDKYDSLKTRMLDALRVKGSLFDGFEYLPEQSNDFFRYADGKSHISTNGFASKLNIPQMIVMFINSTSLDMQTIRAAFKAVYEIANINEYYSRDKKAIEQLLSGISEAATGDTLDMVQKLQCNWFTEELEKYLRILSQQ